MRLGYSARKQPQELKPKCNYLSGTTEVMPWYTSGANTPIVVFLNTVFRLRLMQRSRGRLLSIQIIISRSDDPGIVSPPAARRLGRSAPVYKPGPAHAAS